MTELRVHRFRDEETAKATFGVTCVSVSCLGFLQFPAASFFLR
jgi:hypothetical protein